jgi:2-polyprenyl-6-hydroxyphenyl methylase/3-demethylubiquinone-9 3-methyltransferase
LQNLGIKKLNNLEILDIGCGGGLTCEPLARLGARLTGIDFIENNIKIAKSHSKKNKLHINYFLHDLEDIKIVKKFDIILMLEVLEHIEDWPLVIKNIKKNLKPGGKIIFSTINRTKLSKIFAIYFAENIFNWIPKNTHDYNKLITHQELKEELTILKFNIENIMGMNFNILTRNWVLNKIFYLMNYFCTAKLN